MLANEEPHMRTPVLLNPPVSFSSQGASDNIDPDTRNMQTVSKHKNVTLCLWANLFKNPRLVCESVGNIQIFSLSSHWHTPGFGFSVFSFTGFDFKEAGLSFKLPEELAVSDIAVRILHTHYDHLSILSRLRHPPLKSIVEEIPLPVQEPEETRVGQTNQLLL